MKLKSFNPQDLEDANSQVDFKIHVYDQEIKYKKTFRFECVKNTLLNINRINKNYEKRLRKHYEYENIVKHCKDEKLDLSILSELTEGQQKVLVAFLEHGNLIDTAKALNANYETTKVHFRNGVQKLKSILKKEGPWRLLQQ